MNASISLGPREPYGYGNGLGDGPFLPSIQCKMGVKIYTKKIEKRVRILLPFAVLDGGEGWLSEKRSPSKRRRARRDGQSLSDRP